MPKFQLAGVSPCRQTHNLALAHCRGIRRMHLNWNVPACEQAPISQFGYLRMAHCYAKDFSLTPRVKACVYLNFLNGCIVTIKAFIDIIL